MGLHDSYAVKETLWQELEIIHGIWARVVGSTFNACSKPAPRWVSALFSLTLWMTSECCKHITSSQGLPRAAAARKATDFFILDSYHKQKRAKTKVKLYLPARISEFIARNDIRIEGVTLKVQRVGRPASYPHPITDFRPHCKQKGVCDTPWHWVLSLQTLLSTRSNHSEIRTRAHSTRSHGEKSSGLF